jgi:hypothetical protein
MRKSRQPASGKRQDAIQKAQRRAYQKNATRRTGVHLPPPAKTEATELKEKPVAKTASCAPKGGRPRRMLRRGQPHCRSKLTAELSAEICGYVADGLGWQQAAALVGVHRNVVTIWKARGEADPESEYGDFLRAAEVAELRREHVHLKYISQDRDWKARRWLLCNFRPEKYRTNTFSAELMGKDGLPLIPPENSFLVKLELHEPEVPSAAQPQFSIVAPDGSRTIWNGPPGEMPQDVRMAARPPRSS